MAGVVSSKLIDRLTAVLTDKLIQEVSLAVNYKADLQSMCDELVAIKSLLKDVKGKRNSDLVTNWLQKLQAFLIDAVETVEKCDEQEAKNKFMFFCGNPFFSWRMVRQIRELKKRISDIHANGEKYIRYLVSVIDVNARAYDSAFSQAKKSSALPLDDPIVGMDQDIQTISSKVLRYDRGQQGPRVIAVLGMAGIGKTLLVREVFHNMAEYTGEGKRFRHRFWLPVTQIFDIKELLHEMWMQIEDDDHGNDNMLSMHSTERLRHHIHRKLKGKCCLFVLDDVWQKDILQQIGLALGTSEGINEKSKIVVTTRSKVVSRAVRAYYTHPMKYLSEDDQIRLFCIHAFRSRRNEPEQLPNHLEHLRQLILEKCLSLPLVIQEIGKSMAQVSQRLYNWEGHFNRLDEAVINNQVMPTLTLSYEGLPDHLKPCFLYFSSFPPNTQINTEHLVYPWIAQEFVSVSSTGVVAYDVALSYLRELADYCMIRVSDLHSDGRVTYHMEDMLHRLALSESDKEGKCLLMPAKRLKQFPLIEEYRGAHRISLVGNEISGTINEEMAIQCPRLRTLLLRQNRGLTSISKTFFHKLKYLVVLDLSQTAITSLPRSIGNLKGLKFLNLSGTKISKLPKFLKSLRSLQYLDVSGCEDLKSLHSEIGEHKDMLYLNVEGCKELVSLPPGISELRSLRTLLLAGVVNAFRSVKVRNLPHLQSLSFSFNKELTSSSEESVSAFMKNMTGQGIRFLSVQYDPSTDHENYQMKLPYTEHLESLILRNCMLKPAHGWYDQFWKLRMLVLDGNGNASSYAALHKIPNLKMLSLLNNRRCREFPQSFGEADAFPELQTFEINNLLSLRSFRFLPDAMPNLKSLTIKNCDQLSIPPRDRDPLYLIKQLIIENCKLLEGPMDHYRYDRGSTGDSDRSYSISDSSYSDLDGDDDDRHRRPNNPDHVDDDDRRRRPENPDHVDDDGQRRPENPDHVDDDDRHQQPENPDHVDDDPVRSGSDGLVTSSLRRAMGDAIDTGSDGEVTSSLQGAMEDAMGSDGEVTSSLQGAMEDAMDTGSEAEVENEPGD